MVGMSVRIHDDYGKHGEFGNERAEGADAHAGVDQQSTLTPFDQAHDGLFLPVRRREEIEPGASEAQRLRSLEDENSRLKWLGPASERIFHRARG